MIILNFGGGTNSTGLLIGAVERGIFPDLIVFADTGSEMPHTYRHLDQVNEWLRKRGRKPIFLTGWVRRDGEYKSLHDYCLDRSELPSRAYGYSGCTTKWKQQPIDRVLKRYAAVEAEHAAGRQVERWIGYDADEPQRAERMLEKNPDGHLWRWRAPLIEWGWGRDECVEAIRRAGLEQPGKSSCFMCPSMRKPEIVQLARNYPEQMKVALEIEDRARPNLQTAKGLGRSFSWRDFLNSDQARKMEQEAEAESSEVGTPDVACGCYDGD